MSAQAAAFVDFWSWAEEAETAYHKIDGDRRQRCNIRPSSKVRLGRKRHDGLSRYDGRAPRCAQARPKAYRRNLFALR